MAALQDALECLSPTKWDDIPHDNPSSLQSYMTDIATKARLIVNSIPEPPEPTPTPTPASPSSTNLTDETEDEIEYPYKYAHLNPTSPSARIHPSATRLNTDDPTLQSLQKEWGKPIRVSGAKDNPLEIQIHKTPGRDGKGHWFARRSVHEGLPFGVWREKLSGEMRATLEANRRRLEKGRLPDQSVRGIGAERVVEEIPVLSPSSKMKGEKGNGDEDEVMGHVRVYHVSAQFPKPTTPRDFVALILNWEDGGVSVDANTPPGTKQHDQREKCWMMVSRPCTHDAVPPANGYIRGEYESVEFIREIPAGRPEGLNPVEWIMVTRSDPGGNIPRWMVEKGTPKSICSDAVKFLDWACREPATAGKQSTRGLRRSSEVQEHSQHTAGVGDESRLDGGESSDSDLTDTEDVEHHGLIASFAYLVNAGLERYAPQAVLDYIPGHYAHGHSRQSSRSSTTGSFSSARDGETPATSDESASARPKAERVKSDDAESTTTQERAALPGATDGMSPEEMMKMSKKGGKLSSHEKQLAKLVQRKRDVEAQLEKVRADIQALQLPAQDDDPKRSKTSAAVLAAVDSDRVSSSAASTSSLPGQQASDEQRSKRSKSETRNATKLHKVASGLFQDESKLLKQLEKIEKSQYKEASKIEAQQQKHAEREEKSRSHSENEFLRREVEVLKKEISRLRTERQQWLNLVGSLQEENAKLAAAAHGDGTGK